MIRDQALVPRLLADTTRPIVANLTAIMFGVVMVSLLAQIAIPLPGTPVPITGQTFGVALMALLWGRKRGFAVMLSYLALGGMGLPIFAGATAGLMLGPTIGYLVGMLIASYWMGFLADSGWTRTYPRTWLAAVSGSAIVFTCGLTVLSFFIPPEHLLTAGLYPFIPGDVIKTLLASWIAYQARKGL